MRGMRRSDVIDRGEITVLTQENRIVEEGSITVQFDLGTVYLSPLSGSYPKHTLDFRRRENKTAIVKLTYESSCGRYPTCF